VELELEYRKPDSKETRMPHDQEATAQQLRSIPAQAQSAGAFAQRWQCGPRTPFE